MKLYLSGNSGRDHKEDGTLRNLCPGLTCFTDKWLCLLTTTRIVIDKVHLDLVLVEKWYNTYVHNTNTMCARDYHMTLLAVHNQEITQVSPDPFPRERVGSGDETRPTAILTGHHCIDWPAISCLLGRLVTLPGNWPMTSCYFMHCKLHV